MLQPQQSNTQRHYGGNGDLFSANIEKVKIPSESMDIYNVIRKFPKGITALDLCKHTKKCESAIRRIISDLIKPGLIERRRGAKYALSGKKCGIETIVFNLEQVNDYYEEVRADIIALLSSQESLSANSLWEKSFAISRSRFQAVLHNMYISGEIIRDERGLYSLNVTKDNGKLDEQQPSVVQQVATEMVHQAPTQQESAQKEASATLRLAKAIAANSLLEKERQKKLLTEIECLKAQVLQLSQDAAQIKAFFHNLINAMTS